MSQSEHLFTKALQCLPGGVNSPVRSFSGVGGNPIFIQRAQGAYIVDVDSQMYVDYVCSWGAIILGHAHHQITEMLKETIERGTSFGAPSPLEIQLAEKIIANIPSIEMVRMVSSGTEATMTALRMARALTGKPKIIKFEGCYHGHHDSLLVNAGSGALTLGHPSSAGVPQEAIEHTLLAPYNDLRTVQRLFEQYPNQIAGIIVEPVAGNMGCVLPKPDFLPGLRELCDHYKSLLIFDEVMTGFRVGLNGAQGLFNVKPDLTCLAKVIGGGLPVGAVGGPKGLMECLAPLGPVYQAGTLSGNPLAMAAGLATLSLLETNGFFEKLTTLTQRLIQGIEESARANNIPLYTTQAGGLFGLFFSPTPIHTLKDIPSSHVDYFRLFFHAMLQQGIYLPPSAYEAYFTSAAHSTAEIEKTLVAINEVFNTVRPQ
jgi:glutamate-1-semialdehyde 2,1-aminomutase